MYEIFMSNFVTMFLVVGFILLLATGNVFNRKIQRLFFSGAVCIVLLIAVDIMDTYLAKASTLNNLRYLSSALGYTIRPIALGIFISILLRNGKNLIYLWVPIFFESLIALTSYWTHLMFYFDQNNVFYRGPLGLLPHALCITYMGLLLYYALVRFKTTDIGEMLLVVYIVSICLIAVFFETVYSMRYLLTGAITCACIVYYTYLYIQIYKTDILTGVFNRRTFEKDTEKKLNKSMALICIDLNNLKTINDTEGHGKGDEVLTIVAQKLLEVAENKFKVYRLGGDEFFVTGVNKTLDDADKFILKAKKQLEATEYSAAFGSSLYKPGESFEEACTKADAEMYKNKLENRS